MTTPAARYKYMYKINQISLFGSSFNLRIHIGDFYYHIIGMAIVTISLSDVLRCEVVESTTELRYVILDEKNEPDVSYRENPDFKGVERV